MRKIEADPSIATQVQNGKFQTDYSSLSDTLSGHFYDRLHYYLRASRGRRQAYLDI